MFSIAVGLTLLAIVERSLLERTPLGDPGPAGSDLVLQSPGRDARNGPPAAAATASSEAPARPSGDGDRAEPSRAALIAQIRKITRSEYGTQARRAYGGEPGGRPIVAVERMTGDRDWAFGTTALPVPDGSQAMPRVAFFAARWGRGQWQTALSGTSAFSALLGRMPPALMSDGEARTLRRHSALTSGRAVSALKGRADGLVLPWKGGDAWTLGLARERGGDGPALGTLAFWGGDGRVRAAAGGRLYRFCAERTGRGLVMVVHPSGLATTYYRIRDVTPIRGGGVVERGDVLGRTGTAAPCGGGEVPRELVRFGVRRGAGEVPLKGAPIGGWTLRERTGPLPGLAERGAMKVLPGMRLANLGPDPAPPATKKRSPRGEDPQQ